MTTEDNTIETRAATPMQRSATGYADETMTRAKFKAYVARIVGRKNVAPSEVLLAPYHRVEYLNAPAGLLVLAHHDTIDGQVDGIHPASIGKSIDDWRNIIEPLKGKHTEAPEYNVHYMTRRSQGNLVLEAFGRMIDGGDDEAPDVTSEEHFILEIYNTKIGPIVGAVESDDRVCVIRPKESHERGGQPCSPVSVGGAA